MPVAQLLIQALVTLQFGSEDVCNLCREPLCPRMVRIVHVCSHADGSQPNAKGFWELTYAQVGLDSGFVIDTKLLQRCRTIGLHDCF